MRDWTGGKAGQERNPEKGKRSELDTSESFLPSTHSSPVLVKYSHQAPAPNPCGYVPQAKPISELHLPGHSGYLQLDTSILDQ